MDLTQLANLGEFIGGIAVLATLIYLSVQVRGQAQESRHATILALTQQWNAYMTSISDSGEVAEFWVRGLREFQTFDAGSYARWSALAGRFVRIVESLYLQRIDGRLDPRIWHGIFGTLHDALAYPGMQAWWGARQHWYCDELKELMEASLTEVRDRTPTMYPEEISSSEE